MAYEAIRYSVTRPGNDGVQEEVVVEGLLTREIRPMLTYAFLLAHVTAALRRKLLVGDGQRNPQQVRNRRYQLRALLHAAGKTETDVIGEDFGAGFDTLCDRAVRSVPSDRTRADLRRGLCWWRRQYNELLREKSYQPAVQPVGSFADLLHQRIAASGLTRSGTAVRAEIPPPTLYSWLAGHAPGPAALPRLARLESVLELPAGTLAKYALPARGTGAPAPASEYRERLRQLRKDRYRLRNDEVSDQLRDEWLALLQYKTSMAPQLARSPRAIWRLTSGKNAPRTMAWFNTVGSRYCPAADSEWKHVTSLIGFLRNKPAEHGLTVAVDVEPTLALFAVPQVLEPYFAWLVERAGGIANNHVKTLANFVQCLTVDPHGWLYQQPAAAEKLPATLRPTADWESMCAAANRIATLYRREAKGQQSRDPFEPIRPLLALPEPFAPVCDAIHRLDALALAAGAGSMRAAQAKRDAALMTVMMSIPLRQRNIVNLTYRDSGDGTLRKEPDGQYWIRIPADQVKNRKAIAAPLPSSATARLDEYLAVHRPRLLAGATSDYVFVAGNTNGKGRAWWTLGNRLFNLTRTLIPGCMGFHTHMWRHLFATRWLEKHPDDYLTVALLLGDDMDTVMRYYGRPSASKAAGRANQEIDDLFSRKRRSDGGRDEPSSQPHF